MSLNGILLVDKPEGFTSHDVVGRCRRWLKRRDIGHAGTLDPMATGLLVVLVGQATKLSDYLLNGHKSYQAQFLLGKVTDTDDITGEVLEEVESFSINAETLRKEAFALSGEVELPVPIYSAVKVKGEKLYNKARAGVDFVPPVKTMSFESLQILDFDGRKLSVSFRCSKGSYVRAWGKALGESLGCGATMTQLKRVSSEPYTVDQALSLEIMENHDPLSLPELANWVSMGQCLPDWPIIKVDGLDEKLLSNGQISRKLERFLELEFAGRLQTPGLKVLSRRSDRLICLLGYQQPMNFKIRRVFPHKSNQ